MIALYIQLARRSVSPGEGAGPMNIFFAYAATLVIFAVVDTAWLGLMADRIYRPLIGPMLAENFRLAPAIAFYAVYAAGLTLFAVRPGLAEGGWKTASVVGRVASACSPTPPTT
jgi:uncharacterized membrane protein